MSAPIIPLRAPLLTPEGRVTTEWVHYFREVGILAAAESDGSGTSSEGDGPIAASRLTGTIDPARIAALLDGNISRAAAIAWTKISKSGSSLGDLEIRDASMLVSGLVALARGGAGADLSGTGGTGHVVKQSALGAVLTVAALLASEMPSGIDATKIADGSVDNTEFQYLNGARSNIQDQIDTKLFKPQYMRSGWSNIFANANINTEGLTVGWTLNGTRAWSPDADYGYVDFSTSSSGAIIGLTPSGTHPATASFATRHGLDLLFEIVTGPSLSNVRYSIGLIQAVQGTGTDTPSGIGDSLRFRFSSAAGDTTWQAQASGATTTTSAVGAIVTTSTRYVLRIVVPKGGGSAMFYVNDEAPVTISTTLPGVDTPMGCHIAASNLAAEAKSLKFGGFYFEWMEAP